MALRPETLARWRPSALRRRMDERLRRSLIGSAGDALLAFDGELVHLESARRVPLDGGEPPPADALARAARELLPAAGRPRPAVLLLAPAEFVATAASLPGVGPEDLAPALALQADSLLPGCERELELAARAAPGGGDRHVALWMLRERLDALFAAFAGRGLELAAVRPRVLALCADEGPAAALDRDGRHETAVGLRDGALTAWEQVLRGDLDDAGTAAQWREAAAAAGPAAGSAAGSADDYLGRARRGAAGAFFPAGALAARRRARRGRRAGMAAAAAAAALLLLSLPFAVQMAERRSALARLEAARGLSAEARADRAVVVRFESEWGPVNDFPRQPVRQALYRLQSVLGGERLSSLELSDGLIRIQGTSTDPQAILQRLEQDPMFAEAVFSRATSNDRYFIELRLGAVSFEAYMVRHFPDAI